MSAKLKKKSIKHPRGHLSRDGISRAGLKVARQEGIQNLTMKRLAEELDVTPMAIYRHFEDKSDLIDAVLDRFVQENDVCNHQVPASDWQHWLCETYSKMYRGLQSMPSVYPYLSSASRFGPGATAVVEQTLSTLQAAGFSHARATQAANALNGFVIGCAIMDNAFYETIAQSSDITQAEQGPAMGLESGLQLIIAGLQHDRDK